MARWSRNDRDALIAYTDREIYLDAGQGGFEIRTFIALATAARGPDAVRHFQPIPIFSTGCTIGVMAIA